MLIIDSHLDLSWNALQWNRNLQDSVHAIRQQEKHLPEPGRGQGTVALPDMRQGNVALCFATLLARSTGHAEPHIDYLSPLQAYAAAQGQLAYYHALSESGEARLIKDIRELNEHIAEWEKWENKIRANQPPLGLIISMESADPILQPEQLAAWKESGLRLIGPAHYGLGRYAGGTSTEFGLTEDGIDLLHEMDRLGVILDLTHLSDEAFWLALDHFGGPVIASHNNCRALVPHQRQFDNSQIKAIIDRDGVIGAALDNWMLIPNWVRGSRDNRPATLKHVSDHIDHICQLAGNAQHAAIGSDLDSGFGREQSPSDLDTIADLQKLVEILDKRGYRTNDISLIMHGNWLRLLRNAWIS